MSMLEISCDLLPPCDSTCCTCFRTKMASGFTADICYAKPRGDNHGSHFFLIIKTQFHMNTYISKFKDA